MSRLRPYLICFSTTKEVDGRYSTVAANLPGAGSSGDTRQQSIDNAIVATSAVIVAYRESQQPIPWAVVPEMFPDQSWLRIEV